ncbi:MAG: hypothetical protein JWR23_3420 [Mucilaginibacter sp.]|nr:hypothetical protein [Mucilaginibacter sp.]
MICNNVRTNITVVVNYCICMLHSIAQCAFFLNYSVRLIFSRLMCVAGPTCNYSVLMRINHILARYKTE